MINVIKMIRLFVKGVFSFLVPPHHRAPVPPIISFLLLLAVLPAVGKGKYQNFKVSTYIRAQDVARMADERFLNETWETVSSQVDLDKIYLETHRDAFTVDEKTMTKVKKFFLSKGLEVGGGITYTRSEQTDFETYSYARPVERQQVREVAEYTAKLFDDFILDDFFFIDLKNDDEIAAKGTKSWTEYRLRLMADAGRELVVKTLDGIEAGTLTPRPQEGTPTAAPKIFKDDCFIDFNRPARQVVDFIRGLSPYPAALLTLINPQGEKVLFKIFDAIAVEDPSGSPKTLICDEKKVLKIGVSDGFLQIISLQMSGKRKNSVEDFLRGNKLTDWKLG